MEHDFIQLTEKLQLLRSNSRVALWPIGRRTGMDHVTGTRNVAQTRETHIHKNWWLWKMRRFPHRLSHFFFSSNKIYIRVALDFKWINLNEFKKFNRKNLHKISLICIILFSNFGGFFFNFLVNFWVKTIEFNSFIWNISISETWKICIKYRKFA